jgi:hypothetical protein
MSSKQSTYIQGIENSDYPCMCQPVTGEKNYELKVHSERETFCLVMVFYYLTLKRHESLVKAKEHVHNRWSQDPHGTFPCAS